MLAVVICSTSSSTASPEAEELWSLPDIPVWRKKKEIFLKVTCAKKKWEVTSLRPVTLLCTNAEKEVGSNRKFLN
jgi:hypothetical protein